MTTETTYDPTDEHRSIFDWIIWLLIHGALIGGIVTIAFYTYSAGLATWVGVSAFIAGIVCMYLFAKLVPGETLMKVILYTVAAANAGYLAYNGAHEMGIDLFNTAQAAKYGAAAKEAGTAKRRGTAQAIMSQAGKDTALEKAFGTTTSTIAGLLAFLELATALIVFAMASRRVAKVRQNYAVATGNIPPPLETARPRQTPAMSPPLAAQPTTAQAPQGAITFSSGGGSNFTPLP